MYVTTKRSFCISILSLIFLAPCRSVVASDDGQFVPTVGSLTLIESAGNPVLDFAVSDFDGDGLEEIAEIRHDNDHPVSLAIREIEKNNYTFPVRPLPLDFPRYAKYFPLSGHPVYKYLTYRLHDDKAWLDVYDQRFQMVDSLATICGRPDSVRGFWNGNVNYAFLTDLNRDQRLDLLIAINTASDGQPRAILGYDLLTRQLLLNIPLAPMPSFMSVEDVDNNGQAEIIVGLGGASEGPFFGEFLRNGSYLVVFRTDGSVRFSKHYGGESGYVNFDVGDVDGDYEKEIVLISYSFIELSRHISQLSVLDGHDFHVKAELLSNAPLGFRSLFLLDADGDGVENIYALSDSNIIRSYHFDVLQKNLKAEASFYTDDNPGFLGSDDINADGKLELFIRTVSGIWITDAALHPLARIPLTGESSDAKLTVLKKSTARQRQYALLHNKNLYLLKIPVEQVFAPAFLRIHTRLGNLRISFLPAFFSLLLFLLLAILSTWRLLRAWRVPWRLLPDSNRVGFLLVDDNHIVRHGNTHFLRLTELNVATVKGHPVRQVFSENELLPVREMYELFLKRGERYLKKEVGIGSMLKRKNLEVEIIRMDHNVVLMLFIDLSESTQTERLKWWAAMAQRMAHKTKTPLATVLLAVQRLQRVYRKESPHLAHEYDRITAPAISEIERVRDIINTFMKFAKLDDPLYIDTEFTRVIQEGLNDYLRRIPDGVEIKTSFEAQEMPVRLDVKQFKEALFNILDNAVNAILGDGAVMITTMKETHPLQEWGGASYAVVEIADSGMGISKSDMNRIFEPGFTTRRDGSGMGLILAKNVIESHNGEIQITSEPPMGSTVVIRLPILRKVNENNRA